MGPHDCYRPGPLPVGRRSKSLPKIGFYLGNIVAKNHAGPVLNLKVFLRAAQVLVVPHASRRKFSHGFLTLPGNRRPFADQFVVPKGQFVPLSLAFAEQAKQLVPLLHNAVIPLQSLQVSLVCLGQEDVQKPPTARGRPLDQLYVRGAE